MHVYRFHLLLIANVKFIFIARFSFSLLLATFLAVPFLPLLLDLLRRATQEPQIYNLPVAMRIIIEYQKLCYSLFHSAHLLPARPFREDAQYKSPGHYANPPNDTVPTSILRSISRRFGSPPPQIPVRTFG